jgi:5-dehydro-6-demethoxyfumagillol dioxygenase
MPMGLVTEEVDEAVLRAAVSRIAEDGYAVIPGVLDPPTAALVLERLRAAAQESERRGVSTYAEGLDPNSSNVRVWNLIDLDPVFGDLIAHPLADAVVAAVLGPNYIVSNYFAPEAHAAYAEPTFAPSRPDVAAGR